MTHPTIAILGGTGKEGPGLALRWAYNGYPVLIGSRQAEKAEATATELNQTLGKDIVRGYDNDQAARLANISVLTVVQAAHQAALEGLREALQGKILVDATARVDFRDPHPPAPPSAGEIAQEILGPGVRVVAALQTVPAHALKHNLGQPLDFDVLVCANDVDAAQQVIALVEGADMRGYYAGKLDNAVVVEGVTSLLISMNKFYKIKTASVKVTGIGSA
ncbi:MAG: NADPH-dependent F420 reductase [Anaerolineales bacterium]|nr:NADPH-dependent F420 reductase [Anaerolineales bacterium]